MIEPKLQKEFAESKDETVSLKIAKIVPNGFGLAFAEGITIFVPLAVEGDEVRARIFEHKGKIAFAEIVEIISPSQNRVAPSCEHFGICGGCDFQQMNYAAQLAAKTEMIRDCISRISKIEVNKGIEMIASPNEWNYRTRAQWHANSREGRIGYYKRDSHDVVNVNECPILAPELQRELKSRQSHTKWEEMWIEKIAIDAATDGKEISTSSDETIEQLKELSLETKFGTFAFNAKTFFQGNLSLVEKLIEIATRDARGEIAFDLFCGVGIFALALARNFKKVLAVEQNEAAVEFARKNALFNKTENAAFEASDVAAWLFANKEKPDFILLDPPRAGVSRKILNALVALMPREISYVSCDPATLARDLRVLVDGGFAINSITALDMFPQTHHVETVVRLKMQD